MNNENKKMQDNLAKKAAEHMQDIRSLEQVLP
jgi:hypothetical protein